MKPISSLHDTDSDNNRAYFSNEKTLRRPHGGFDGETQDKVGFFLRQPGGYAGAFPAFSLFLFSYMF